MVPRGGSVTHQPETTYCYRIRPLHVRCQPATRATSKSVAPGYAPRSSAPQRGSGDGEASPCEPAGIPLMLRRVAVIVGPAAIGPTLRAVILVHLSPPFSARPSVWGKACGGTNHRRTQSPRSARNYSSVTLPEAQNACKTSSPLDRPGACLPTAVPMEGGKISRGPFRLPVQGRLEGSAALARAPGHTAGRATPPRGRLQACWSSHRAGLA